MRNTSTRRRRRRRGFSLVEVIVVIGIVAILIALLLPAIARAREQAKTVQCMSQLRQVGVALTSYAVANRGHYPTWSNWQVYGGDGTGEDDPGLGWTEMLEPHIGKPTSGIYQCPAFPPEAQFNYFLGMRWVVHGAGKQSLMQTEVKQASQFVLGGECTHQRLYPKPWGECVNYIDTNDADKDDIRWKCLAYFGEAYGWNAHPNGNNVLFGDGHVATYDKFVPSDMTYDPQNPGVAWEDLGPLPE
jgi:prepilin-type N-terminal cleavage/methylation domain-containing protein/prepilin-type processing-associated H-X9-DG protein